MQICNVYLKWADPGGGGGGGGWSVPRRSKVAQCDTMKKPVAVPTGRIQHSPCSSLLVNVSLYIDLKIQSCHSDGCLCLLFLFGLVDFFFPRFGAFILRTYKPFQDVIS